MPRPVISERIYHTNELLTPRARIGPAALHVSEGVVVAVAEPQTGEDAVDLPGTVIPGLVDLQVNGWRGRDVAEATPDAIEDISSDLPAVGVTSWLPTIISCPRDDRLAAMDAVQEVVRRGRPARGARVLGVHLEGPWISRARAGAHDPRVLAAPAMPEVAQSLNRHPGLVRIVTLAPELPGGLDAVRQITSAGAVASIGHTDASYYETDAAVRAGARMATHLFNAMRPLHHREPGVVGAVLTEPRVVAGLIADGVHVDPAAVLLAFRCKPERVVLVSDAVGGGGLRRSDAARLDDGTLAGALRGLCEGIAVAVAGGVRFDDAVQAATLTPADVVRAPVGRLVPGAPADFVVLDERRRPVQTYVAGERVWSAGD